MKIDKKIIKELSDYLEEFGLTELEYTEKDTKIKVSKNNVSINNQTIPSNKISPSSSEVTNQDNKTISGIEIKSPIIGTAYHAPEPGAKKFIEIHMSNIYKREEFRKKSLISDVVSGGIFGLGDDGYILAIISMQKLLTK